MLDKQLLRQRAEHLRGEPRPARPKKTYLSRADRQEAMVLAAIAGKLDELIAAWEDRRKPGVLLRAAKLARYWAYQALEHLNTKPAVFYLKKLTQEPLKA